MTKLFIANTTKQHHEFVYRVPEDGRNVPIMQKIPVGECVMIYKDDSTAVLDAIIDQHARYGLVAVSEIDRTKDFIGLAYQFDQPIDVDKIIRALSHNDMVLKAMGEEQRKQAAVAIASTIDAKTEDAGVKLAGLDVTIEEVDRRDGTDTALNETVSVAKEGTRPQRRTRG